jgi:hypothetical protein
MALVVDGQGEDVGDVDIIGVRLLVGEEGEGVAVGRPAGGGRVPVPLG